MNAINVSFVKTENTEKVNKIISCALTYTLLKRAWSDIYYEIGFDEKNDDILIFFNRKNLSISNPSEDFIFFLRILFHDLEKNGFKVLGEMPFDKGSIVEIDFDSYVIKLKKT